MKKINVKYKTDYLLPKNNFWVGMGSVLNLNGHYFDYKYSKSVNEADFRALYSDWKNIGEDLRNGKCEFENKNRDKLCLK